MRPTKWFFEISFCFYCQLSTLTHGLWLVIAIATMSLNRFCSSILFRNRKTLFTLKSRSNCYYYSLFVTKLSVCLRNWINKTNIQQWSTTSRSERRSLNTVRNIECFSQNFVLMWANNTGNDSFHEPTIKQYPTQKNMIFHFIYCLSLFFFVSQLEKMGFVLTPVTQFGQIDSFAMRSVTVQCSGAFATHM